MEQQKTRPLSILGHWLDECNVPYERVEDGPVDLLVQTADHTPLGIVLTDSLDTPPLTEYPTLLLSIAAIAHLDLSVRLTAFQSILQAAGYDAMVPVDRGPMPSGRLQLADDFDSVTLRHTEFRRTPNCVADQLRDYQSVMDVSLNTAWRRYRWIWQRFGLERDDLSTWAKVWTMSWLNEYSTPSKDENRRLLHTRLWQRFAELAHAVERRTEQVMPDMRGATIDTPTGPRAILKGFECMLPAEEDTSTVRPLSRKRASQELTKALDSLPPQEALEVLQHAANNPYLDPEARSVAQRRLQVIAGVSEVETQD